MKLRTVAAVLALGAGSGLASAATFTLATGGEARVRIVVADEADESEHTASKELADYLFRLTGATFSIVTESDDAGTVPSLRIGPSAMARENGPDPQRLGAEEWVVRTQGQHLLLYGGRPRGTLYAVYEFLEHLGVRWWTPYAEHVPRREDLMLEELRLRGGPAFEYRDILIRDGPLLFRARSRLNGESNRLGPAWGGAWRYGPPGFVHTFYLYVPPAEHFKQHPEYFSEIAGMRFPGEGQLCLTAPGLFELVVERMGANIEQSRREAVEQGTSAARLFSFSQNDWGRPCSCPVCAKLVEQQQSQAGPLLEFVNRLAGAIGERYPDVRIETLAYDYTLDPPLHLKPAGNVIVRLTGLHQRDLSKPTMHPANRDYAEALRGWSARTDHLHVWDYAASFSESGELPLPNLRDLAADYPVYRDLDVRGVFVQLTDSISSDLHDLKVWVIAKLLVDPARDYEALVEEFTDGYYGPAAKSMRRYLRLRERAEARHPADIPYLAEPSAHVYLDAEFFRRSHTILDRAAEAVAHDAELARRIRHARLSLDRATLALWNVAASSGRGELVFEEAARRYRATWSEQIELRLPLAHRGEMLREVDREIAYWKRAHKERSD